MALIQRLDEHLTNMIAAGEVVERPMGVIKELIENALDANATSIEIRIKDGGIENMEVSDNGSGMDPDDALMAFERHSTSKIHTKEDLFSLHSLGFRGEALPSIASVSKVTLTTCDGDSASYVQIEYGKRILVRPHARAKGTTLFVEGLFRKTPARLKHLRTASYESSLITDLVEKFALCRPDVAFKLFDNEIEVVKTNGNGQLIEVIARTLGNQTARNAHLFSASDYDFKIHGAMILPHQNRSNNKGIYVFVNQRIIRYWQLQKAVAEAYHSYMMPDRYPIVILNIEMDTTLADVNVHPSKWEIRLSKEQQLHFLVLDALQNELKKITAGPEIKQSQPMSEHIVQEPLFDVDHPIYYATQEAKPIEHPTYNSELEEVSVREAEPVSEQATSTTSALDTFPQLQLIGQMHGRYILASSPDSLYMIDQHAAKERVNYEKFQDLLLKGDSAEQSLTVPLTFQTKPSIMSRFEELQKLLAEIGINVEAFSGNTLVFRTLPIWLSEVDETAFLEDLVERFENDNQLNLEHVRKEALASLACHSSIRFNHALTHAEMNNIIDELRRCRQPFNCPHGRPTLIRLTTDRLFKEFQR